ncbi:MAG: choice-of-anchor J domain-containing protein [Paramuribaculum sp.]|nr:choice-of-anchor J domain-containing protein [Paramuribaculum sp.]
MKHYYFLLSACLICGIIPTSAQERSGSGKLTPEEILKAPAGSWRLTPRQATKNVGVKAVRSNAPAVTVTSASPQPLIYASMIGNSSWGTSQPYGIYSFSPDAYGFETVIQNYNFNANGGASYIGDNNYLAINSTDFGGWAWVEMHAYDTTSWTEVYNTMGDESVLATDMTYCAADNNVYGCFNNGYGTGYVFGRFDQDTFERTEISPLDEAWIACGADAGGNIFAVTASGKLVTADKQTGALSVIGETGLSSDHMTSGTIDTSTGIFYVATCNDSGSALYSVSLSDGSAQHLYDMENAEELVGMYIAKEAINGSAPAAVTDLKAEFADNSLSGTVSFRLPATTVGGSSMSETLNYEVSSGGKPLASGSGTPGSAISVSVTLESAGSHEITVAVSNSAATGPEASVSVTVTGADESDLLTLPYTETFSSQSDFDSFSVIDVNKDTWTWVYWANKGCALCQFSPTNDSDDYLVTRPVRLEKDKYYVVSCDLWRRGTPYREAYELVMGKAPAAESLSTVILTRKEITDDDVHHETVTVCPTETGIYYLAVHCLSPADAYGLCVDNLTISTGSLSTAPASPSITVKPDFNGATAAEVTVTVPTTDLGGNPVDKITSVCITRNGETVKTFTDPTPGTTLVYMDQTGTDGYVTYGAYAVNASGPGHSSYERVFVGINYPAPPTNVTIEESEDQLGTVTMNWDAPTTDREGNPLNPELVSYMIAHRMNGANLTIVARGIKGTEHTFQALDPEKDKQKFVTYLIFSETAAGVNDRDITQTAPIPVGKPFEMPYAETFGSDNPTPMITTSTSQSAKWSVTNEISDQDGDGYYLMYDGFVGTTGTVATGKIAVSGDSPVFSLWYMCMEDATDEIVVSVNDGSGFKDVDRICVGDGDAFCWTKAIVPLNEYAGKTVQIRLTYKTVAYKLAIDNVRVEAATSVNLSARGISVPYKANPGVPFEIRLYVANNGIENPGKYSADLYRDGVKVSTTHSDGLEAFGGTTLSFRDSLPAMANNPTSYFAVVNCPGDSDQSDNVTAEATVTLEQLDYPAPTSLQAESNGSMVRLSWNEVVIPRDNVQLTDDIENLRAFSTGLPGSEVTNDNIGDWTTIHADGGKCYVMQVSGSYLRFPNANSYTSFMVFDAEQAGVPSSVLNDWKGHNGSSQCFMAMATIGVRNDKWLISPLLSENAQTISFYAKTPLTDYGLESFEVLYSTTGKETADFIKVGEVNQAVPSEWTKYSYELPAGARYFAIRSTSDDVYALLVDDIEFEKAHPHRSLVLQGYRVYRDASILTSEPLAGNDHFISEYPDGQAHIYNVTALYTTGESAPSNDAGIAASAGLVTETLPIIESGKGYIGIRCAEGLTVSVVRPDGALCFRSLADEEMRINLLPGVYIVDIAGRTTKVIVR